VLPTDCRISDWCYQQTVGSVTGATNRL